MQNMASTVAIFCAPCTSRGTSKPAVKYCTMCQEQLCKKCTEFHKAFKATRRHLLVQSKNKQPQKILDDLELFQTCTEHSNKKTEFYCGEHDALMCGLCILKSDQHKNCTAIVDINKIGKKFKDDHFTDSVKDSYHKMIESAKCTIKDMKGAKTRTSSDLTFIKFQIETVRRKMMEAFDRQTEHIIETISKDLVDNSNRCEVASQSLNNLVEQAEGGEILFKEVVDNCSPSDVFHCILSIIKQCEELNKELERTKGHCSQFNIDVRKSDLVQMLESDQNPLLSCSVNKTPFEIPVLCSDHYQLKNTFKGRISAEVLHIVPRRTVTNRRKEKSETDLADNSSDRQNIDMVESTNELSKTSDYLDMAGSSAETGATFKKISQSDIDIELSYGKSFEVPNHDDKEPWYGGIVCLPGERLVLSDYKNSRLIILKNYTDVTVKNIKYTPGHLTIFKQCLVVCLKDKTSQILLLKFDGDTFKEQNYLPTTHYPKSVKAVDDERLVVSSKSRKGVWFFELFTPAGKIWHQTLLDIKLSGLHDGCVFAIQHLPGALKHFQLVQHCSFPGKLQGFHEDGSPADFKHEVDNVSSLETDSYGRVFVIRFPGEILVLNQEGKLVTNTQRPCLKKLKHSALDEGKTKLFITTFKDSRIHVLHIKRPL